MQQMQRTEAKKLDLGFAALIRTLADEHSEAVRFQTRWPLSNVIRIVPTVNVGDYKFQGERPPLSDFFTDSHVRKTNKEEGATTTTSPPAPAVSTTNSTTTTGVLAALPGQPTATSTSSKTSSSSSESSPYERGNYSPADHSYVLWRTKETHPHFCGFQGERVETSLGCVSWRGLVGGRPYYSSIVSHTGGLARRVSRGGSLGECVPGREWSLCIVWGDASCRSRTWE